METADGTKCGPRLFAHPLLAVLPRSQGSERCSGNKRRLCCQGGAVGSKQGIHSKQESELCLCSVCLANIHKAWSLGNHAGESRGVKERGPGRLNLYENPVGVCGRGVRASEMALSTSPRRQWSHLVLLMGGLRACNVGAFFRLKQMYSGT